MKKEAKNVILSAITLLMGITVIIALLFSITTTALTANGHVTATSQSAIDFLKSWDSSFADKPAYLFAFIATITCLVGGGIVIIWATVNLFLNKKYLNYSSIMLSFVCLVLYMSAGIVYTTEIVHETNALPHVSGTEITTSCFVGIILLLVLIVAFFLIEKKIPTQGQEGIKDNPVKDFAALLEAKKMYDEELITKEEFAIEKSKILSKAKLAILQSNKLVGNVQYQASGKYEALKQIKVLYDNGVLTEEEYKIQKSKFIG